MTKQGEIREGIAQRSIENCEGATQEQCDALNERYKGVDACRYCASDQILSYLHSQGVVIKVCERDVGGGFVGSYTRPEVLYEVEPLIKEE